MKKYYFAIVGLLLMTTYFIGYSEILDNHDCFNSYIVKDHKLNAKYCQTNVWVAWHQDTSKRKRVVWQKVDEIDGNSVMRWVAFGSTNWSNGNNVWNTQTKEWENY